MKKVRSDRLLINLLNHLEYKAPPNALAPR